MGAWRDPDLGTERTFLVEYHEGQVLVVSRTKWRAMELVRTVRQCPYSGVSACELTPDQTFECSLQGVETLYVQ
jgi:hypothetical protein